MALLDSSGNEVVSYHYNAWGELLSTTASTTGMLYSLALYNPLRYRGYVYDRETGLYYLQSRYYNPEICRFINADAYLSTGQGVLGYNMFAYCNNNPVMFTDFSGSFPWIALIIAAVVIVAIDHNAAKHQPEGGYALHTASNEKTSTRGVYIEGSGYECDANGVRLCDVEAGVVDAKITGEYLTVDAVNLFTANAVAEIDWSGDPEVDISAYASIYSPGAELTIPLGIFDITLSCQAHLGGIGAGVELDPNSGKFRVTPPMVGIGGSFGVDIDWN